MAGLQPKIRIQDMSYNRSILTTVSCHYIIEIELNSQRKRYKIKTEVADK